MREVLMFPEGLFVPELDVTESMSLSEGNNQPAED